MIMIGSLAGSHGGGTIAYSAAKAGPEGMGGPLPSSWEGAASG
jgi:hypothetical protein